MITESARTIVKVIQSCRSFEQLDNASKMYNNWKGYNESDENTDSDDFLIDGVVMLWEISKKADELTEKAKL